MYACILANIGTTTLTMTSVCSAQRSTSAPTTATADVAAAESILFAITKLVVVVALLVYQVAA